MVRSLNAAHSELKSSLTTQSAALSSNRLGQMICRHLLQVWERGRHGVRLGYLIVCLPPLEASGGISPMCIGLSYLPEEACAST
jgi:hypothetical protein